MRIHIIDKANNNPAYHLAVGSAGTARDLAQFTVDDNVKGELLRLADNCLQIADILVQRELTSETDMRAVCEHLGFDPTNHHNAAKCPYCRGSDR